MAAELIINTRVEGNAAKELKNIQQAGEDTTKSTDKLSSSFTSLTSILAGVGFAAIVKEAVSMADTYKLMEARLSLVTKNTNELVSAQSKLFTMSQNNRAELEATTGLYTKLSMATESMNKTQREVLAVTDAVGKSLKISGAGAVESASAMNQLGQALASGALRGDELNSIMESAPRLAKAIADGLGVTIGELRQLGADGKLTAEKVFGAIEKSGAKLDAEFKKIPPTVAESFTTLNNNVTKSVAEFDKLHNITGTVAQAITNVGNSIDSGTISTFVNVVESATVAFVAYKAVMIGTVAIQTSYNWWVAATTVTSTSYNIATNVATASTTRLSLATGIATVAQRAFNLAVLANPYVIAAAAIAGGIGLITSKIMDYNEALGNQSKAYKTNQDAYNKSYAKTIADTGESLQKLEEKRKSFEIGMNNAKTAGNTAAYNVYKQNVANVTKEINAHNQAINHQIGLAQKSSKQTFAPQPIAETPEQKAARIRAERERLHDAEVFATAMTEINGKISEIGLNDFDKENIAIDQQAQKYREDKVGEIKIAEFVSKSKADIRKKYDEKADSEALSAIKAFNESTAKLEFQADQDRESALKTYNEGLVSAQIETYTAMGDTTSAYYLQEEEKMRKLAETGWYTNEQMLAIKTKDNEKFQKEQWDRDNKFWADTFVNINKAMDDQFFNAMSGKFTSFGDWLKDFWGSITQSMTRGLSKSLADTIMGTGNNSEGGIANWFKSYGGFSGVMGGASTPSYLLGATTDAAGLTTTTGGTILNSAGQIVSSGSDSMTVLDGLNSASTANSLYSAYTGGISGSIASGSASLSGMAYNMGWTTGGDFFAGGASGAYGGGTSVSGGAFGTGQSMGAFANGAAQVGAAYMAAYYTGRGIDKLTGSDTYSGDVYGQLKDFGKMSTTDKAILATLSMIPGGSILAGGLIGKRKTSSIGSGIEFNSTGSAENVDARSYIDMKSTKKSWFKSSTSYWTEYQALSDKYTEAIASTFRSYDYLLTQMGESAKVSISAGKYAGTSFQDAITKSFISVFTSNSMSEYNTSQLYTIWSDYASSINKTMMEAFSSSISGYIDTTRSFTEWKLGSGSVDQLKFTADYLAKDFNALSDSMGVSGLTVENYLQKYDEAIKTSFSPETISTWKNLGNALMSATDANTKYTDSLKSVQSAILPQDMMLSKSLDATQIYQTITTQNDTLKYSFAEMITILRNILYNQQFNGLNVGIPA